MSTAPLVLSVSIAGVLGLMAQPMMGKVLLPLMGGGAGVWTAVSVFFLGMLLLGYLYAALIQCLSPRPQKAVHAGMGLAGLVSLFIPASEPSASPIEALLYLCRTVGVSMLVVYATSPLVQGWLSSASPSQMPRVYRLFSISNLAAIAGLLLYPFVLERLLDTQSQIVWWAAGYVALLVCLLFVPLPPPTPRSASKILAKWKWKWWVLPALSTMLMLSTIARLTRETAPVPFIWVVILALFLLSYSLVFAVNWGPRWRAVFAAETPIASAAMMIMLSAPPSYDWVTAALLTASFFVICAYLHGEVVSVRPASEYLPAFYVALATGGLVGGMVILALPTVLDIDIELFAVLSIVGALAIGMGLRNISPRLATASAVLVALVGLLWSASIALSPTGPDTSEILTRGRSFFGTYTVETRENYRVLVHNGTVHGAQSDGIGQQRDPTTYYSKEGPLGAAWLSLLLEAGGHNQVSAGIVGMGVGTTAGYADHGDRMVFFEIDSEIAEKMPRHFSFIPDARIRGVSVEVLVGDGRKLLESMPPQGFDILVIDAFSGCSVPAHLLSTEAFSEYARHLGPRGVLAVHCSNRALDIASVARAGARAAALDYKTLIGGGGGLGVRSIWVVASSCPSRMEVVKKSGLVVEDATTAREVAWTDRFSEVVSIVK